MSSIDGKEEYISRYRDSQEKLSLISLLIDEKLFLSLSGQFTNTSS